ncbi:MAG: rRNA pseudouridine synthase [Rhodospirillales bacterium]|nr:rRNA pseudouridine synthase [Alphaproteobacteria bacterium]MCB9986174.1 rRNA pseudouridine synthase [Rhodospirillales bacterium]USO07269.1 MAG: rRNA pseudouridine synthase [Rhodospirillales bacterium]
MRLNIFLQKAGIGSRREAERLVADGRVTVNGVPATVTTPVEEGDAVCVDGKPVSAETRPLPRLFMVYKPLDVLVTTFDAQGRKTVFELPSLKQSGLPRLMTVGRLDVNSEGLLLLSSDGPLAQAMMHPDTALERVYRIRVHGRLKDDDIARLARGVTVAGVRYKGAKVTEDRAPTGRNTWYTITLTEGKNREIRKLMEYFGCVVNRLIRLQYGPFRLGDLPEGALREVSKKQVAALIDDLKKRGAKL